jgi:hypothetical protein
MRKIEITIEGKTPDHLGRILFLAQWKADNIGPNCNEMGKRGQYFFANVSDHIRRLKKEGCLVIVN